MGQRAGGSGGRAVEGPPWVERGQIDPKSAVERAENRSAPQCSAVAASTSAEEPSSCSCGSNKIARSLNASSCAWRGLTPPNLASKSQQSAAKAIAL
eukprot:8372701-Pyramimonas_sp.AAC.1